MKYLAPREYVSEPGALKKSGGLIAPFARRVFIVGGPTALSVTQDALCASLSDAGIAHTVYAYSGYPTEAEAQKIAAQAKAFGADALAGAGGGRIMDTVKAAGTFAELPVIAIPTIAATCACWAAVSVMYTEDGVMTGALYNAASPVLIIADTDILAAAPPRYLRAGIADTLAKWYESYPNLLTSNDFYLRLVTKYGEFSREILETLGLKVARDAKGVAVAELIEVIDCIFALAGLCGAVRGLADTQGIAHPFYNACSALPALRSRLHGEKVAFGMVMQSILENRAESETGRRIAVFRQLGMPLTLSALGLEPDFDRNFAVIEPILKTTTPHYLGLDHDWTTEELRGAISGAGKRAEAALAAPAITPQPVYNPSIDGVVPFKAARSLESVTREYGLTEIIKLAGNENMHGASPAVAQAIAATAGGISFYPDTGIARLTEAVAAKLKAAPDELLFGSGSFELISFAALAFLEAGTEALIPAPSFGWYSTATISRGAEPVFVPLAGHRLDLERIARRVTARTRVIWLCNPNNPTGSYITGAELDAFLPKIPERVLIVLDEAYIDFAPEDAPRALELIKMRGNILSLRTFSKAYGLAGLRVGYAVGRRELISVLSRVRAPVNVNALAQSAACAALADEAHYNFVISANEQGRQFYYRELARLGIEYIPTAGNFIMFNTGKNAACIELEYLKRGVLLRSGAEFGMPTWVRVTIGTAAQNKRVIEILEEVTG